MKLIQFKRTRTHHLTLLTLKTITKPSPHFEYPQTHHHILKPLPLIPPIVIVRLHRNYLHKHPHIPSKRPVASHTHFLPINPHDLLSTYITSSHSKPTSKSKQIPPFSFHGPSISSIDSYVRVPRGFSKNQGGFSKSSSALR